MKHFLIFTILISALCTAPVGATNVQRECMEQTDMETTTQRLQILDCTETELIEGYPNEIIDYFVKLRNPNDEEVYGFLSLKLYDVSGNYIGEPEGAYKYITLEAGEEQTINLKLPMPPNGEERRVRICVRTDDDDYSFGYFDMKSKTVTEGTPQLSIESVEPADIHLTAGRNFKVKVNIKNTGGFFSNKALESGTLKYEIYARKIKIEGEGTFENLPVYDEEDFSRPVRIDKDETATAEIELGTEAFAKKQLSSYLGAIAPDFVIQPGEYYVSIYYYDNKRLYLDPIPFFYDGEEPNRLYAPEAPVRAQTGSQVTLPVSMENPAGITGFQFDMYLPEGVTCATDDRGFPMVSLGDRTDIYSHTIEAAMQQSGALRVLCYSTTNILFDGNDGNVANIKLDIAADAPVGLQQIRVDNVTLTAPAGKAYLPADFAAELDVYDLMPGDANNDRTVNIADIPATASFILGSPEQTYSREAADANGDGIVRVDDISALADIIMRSPVQTSMKSRIKTQVPGKEYPDNTQHSEGNGEVIPFVLEPGTSGTVTFDLNVPEAELCGVQFDLYLPEGITVDQTSRGVYKFAHVADRIDARSHVIASTDNGARDENGNIIPGTEFIRVLCYSNTSEIFSNREGALLSIPLTAAENLAAGVHEIQLKNIIATTPKALPWGLPDNRLSVISGELSLSESLPQLQGHWTADAAQALSRKLAANSAISFISLAQATDIASDARVQTGNPNTLVYIPEDKTLANTANVVSGASCKKLYLTDGYPFYAPMPFTAAEAAYSRSIDAAGWQSLCLPFAADLPVGVVAERFESLDEDGHTVAFKAVTATGADTPCLFHVPTTGTVTFSATDAAIAATPDVLADGALTATYRQTAEGDVVGKYVLRDDGTGFDRCNATDCVSAFRAYLEGETAVSDQVYVISHGSTPTGIGRMATGGLDIRAGRAHAVLASDIAMTVNIVTAAGQAVRTMRLRPDLPQSVTLPAGAYIANGRKFVVW